MNAEVAVRNPRDRPGPGAGEPLSPDVHRRIGVIETGLFRSIRGAGSHASAHECWPCKQSASALSRYTDGHSTRIGITSGTDSWLALGISS